MSFFKRRLWRVLGATGAVCILSLQPQAHGDAPQSPPSAPVLLQQLARAYSVDDRGALKTLSEQLLADSPDQLRLSPREYTALTLRVADALRTEGESGAAIRLYKRAIAALEALDGKEAYGLLPPLEGLAKSQADIGDYGGALATQKRAFNIASVRLGKSDPKLIPRYDELIAAERRAKVYPTSIEALEAERKALVLRASSLSTTRSAAIGPGVMNPPTHQMVKVFYATDRSRTGSSDLSDFYNAERGPLSFGTAEVSVPKRRDIGSLPTAGWYEYVFRIPPDPSKNLILENVRPAPRAAFFDDLKQTIGRSKLKEEIIFVHGFNTSFEDALYRAATLAVDLNIDGASVLYSWPSDGSLLGYIADRDELSARAQRNLAKFIFDVATSTGAERVHVIAHSMGNAYLLAALEQIKQDHPQAKGIINELIFASPDVSAEDFSDRAPTVADLAHNTTLYSSDGDEALRLSTVISGHIRAGNHQPPLHIEHIQTIDTTKAGGSFDFIGHADFSGPALDDFRSIVWLSLVAPKHCILSRAQGAGGLVWEFGRPQCDRGVFGDALLYIREQNDDVRAAISRLNGDIAAARDSKQKQSLQAVLSVVSALR